MMDNLHAPKNIASVHFYFVTGLKFVTQANEGCLKLCKCIYFLIQDGNVCKKIERIIGR